MSKNKTVTTVINDDFLQWKTDDVIIIHAPTGSGKTHFILNTLLPYAASSQDRIAYFSNRNALKKQTESNISKGDYTENIVVLNYQDGHFKNPKDKLNTEIENCKYWVMDEAHYFLADSQFNALVEPTLSFFSNSKKKHVYILLTATLPYLLLSLLNNRNFSSSLIGWKNTFDLTNDLTHPWLKDLLSHTASDLKLSCLLAKKEQECTAPRKDYFAEKFQKYQDAFSALLKSCKYYSIEANYHHIHPTIYNDSLEHDTLLDIIKQQVSADLSANKPVSKWLIFVASKEEGRNLEKRIASEKIVCSLDGEDKKYFESALITAQTKNRKQTLAAKQLRQIIEEQKFSVQAIIATEVLDNGISIHDDNLKNIVLPPNVLKTQFLQMLGRKRVRKGETINLFLRAQSYENTGDHFRFQILAPMKYVFDLTKLKDALLPSGIYDSSPRNPSDAINLFIKKYTTRGMLKAPYIPYTYYLPVKRDASGFSQLDYADLIDRLQLFGIPKAKLLYDYYFMLRCFESWENLKANDLDHFIILSDSLWSEEQLSWLGLPFKMEYWYEFRKIEELCDTMAGHYLDPNEVEDFKNSLKKCTISISHHMIRPDCKMAVETINKILSFYELPYTLTSAKKQINKKQRRYWILNRTDSL